MLALIFLAQILISVTTACVGRFTFAGIFRAGGVMIILGQMWGWFVTPEPAIITVTAILGFTNLFSSLIIVSHERQQSGFKLKRSFSLQVFGLGAIIILLYFLLR